MQSPDQFATQETRKQLEKLDQLGWYHSIELPDGAVLKGFQSLDQLRSRLAQFPIPANLAGKRVLDIGAWDGWFSFEMERRGASVVAVDSAEHARFRVAKELLDSKVEYQVQDVCQLSPTELGYFDIVLFLGVLYHVKHPLLALEKVCALTTDMACVESFVTDDGSDPNAQPRMEFYETTELRGQFDNWVGPNTACLLAFCRTAGFARASLESVVEQRAHVSCYRRWLVNPASGPAPYITCVANSTSLVQKFSSASDDYVAIWFKSQEKDLTCDGVFPQVGPFASRPVHLHNTGNDGWQVNCKLPPGLPAGLHEVCLRVANSQFSNAVSIGVDVAREQIQKNTEPSECAHVSIVGVTDGKTWESNQVRIGTGSCVSLWLAGLPEESHHTDIKVRLNGAEHSAIFLSAKDREGYRQVNALLPSTLEPGEGWISVVFRNRESAPARVRLVATEC
jgi:tRNA (mo5U34)-methyltransferase